MEINKINYRATDNNYIKKRTKKKQIVIGFSLRARSNHLIRLKHTELGRCLKWSTYTITRTGKVLEHFDPTYYSQFVGIDSVDKNVISVVLENMGALSLTSDFKYVNWLNELCDSNFVQEKKYLGINYWEIIPDAQMESLVALCKILTKEYYVDNTCIDFNHYHKTVGNFKGICFIGNYYDNTTETNPLFNIVNFNKKLTEVDD